MEIELKENERIDDLNLKGLKIIQQKDGFCFGIDSVLLSDFAKNIKNNSEVIDFGTGTGIISILLCGKTKLKNIVGVEVQEEVFEMASRSIKLNNLENRFKVINEDILNLENIYGNNKFDVVVTNPPYKKKNTGLVNENEKKQISRHEITATLEDFIKVASRILKDKGEIYMVNRPERLVDIFYLMRNYKLEPKEIRFICSKQGEPPKMVLIKGVKNAKAFIKIREDLIIYNQDGTYTEEIKNIYNDKKEGEI